MKTVLFFIGILGLSIDVIAQSPLTIAEQRTLDVNQVEALIVGRNNKHWDILGNGNPYYRVPKTGQANAGFANSIWIAGLDNSAQLHIAANTYRQNGADFWPGPIDTTNGNAYIGTAYNKIWKVGCNDIQQFVNAYNNGSVTANTYPIPADMQNYPAKGTGNYMSNMAPFYDANNDGQYNVMNGDYPIIRGHQQILSIYNDKFTTHTETSGLPMGIEIHERSYAYSDPNLPDSMRAVNYTTYYHYEIYNRSTNFYNSVYISGWSDNDLGGYLDDYIGSDSTNNFAYMYNGDNSDLTVGGSVGYGTKIPVISQALIETNCTNDGIDNNQNGIIDEPNEQFKMNKVTYYNNNIGNFNVNTTNPNSNSPSQYYGFMKGFWKDNSPFKFGGTAYAPTSSVSATNYVYSGNPQTQTGWTEATASNVVGDRRFIMSSGPFNFPPNSKLEWGYALVFSQDTSNINTITKFNTTVKRDVRVARNYDKLNNTPQCLPNVITNVSERSLDLKFGLYPNPGKDILNIMFNQNMSETKIIITDLLGRAAKTFNITEGSQAQLNVSDLQSGMYLISIEQKGKRFTEKWVKQN
jgi:hypothetical protein